MNTKDTIQKTLRIPEDYREFEQFIDDSWMKQISEKTQNTWLDPLVFDLLFGFRSTSYTFCLPWLIPVAVASFYEGFRTPTEDFLISCQQLPDVLKSRIGDNWTDKQLRALRREILAICIKTKITANTLQIDREKFAAHFWKELKFSESPVAMALATLPRQCFVSLVFAYEVFFTQLHLKLAGLKRLNDLKILGLSDRVSLRRVFSSQILEDCWYHTSINIAREIRHSFAHAGGKETEKLKRLKIETKGFEILDDELQIYPRQVGVLYKILSKRVTTLIDFVTLNYPTEPALLAIPSRNVEPEYFI